MEGVHRASQSIDDTGTAWGSVGICLQLCHSRNHCGSELQVFSTGALCQSLPFTLPFLLAAMGWTQALTGLLMSWKLGFDIPVSWVVPPSWFMGSVLIIAVFS